MRVKFWGVRGAFAMSGPKFLRYGGNTTAVEIANAAGQRLLIDLGTGATEFAKELMAAEFGQGQGTLPILLSHTHLDHIQGLPFFTPFFIKGNQIRIIGAEPEDESLKHIIQNQLNPHYSPLYGLENLAAGVGIDIVKPGSSLPVEGFEVTAALLPHGASMHTLAFRITADEKTVVFMSDVEYPESEPLPAALTLARDADLLIHDAMLGDDEYASRRGWGHSPVSMALEVATRAGARRLGLFHHSPDSDDDRVDQLLETARERAALPVFAASELVPIEL